MTAKQKHALARILCAAALLLGVSFAPLQGVWQALLFLVPYFVIGWDVLWKSLRNIARGQVFDENFLMALATVGAFGVGEYREAVAVMLFYQVGELFENIAVGKSRKSIASLMDIRPDSATVLRGGEAVTVSPEEVELSETLLIKPGERVPLDCVITKGTTTVNTAALTGESLPQDKAVSDTLVSGSVNLSGVVEARVKSLYAESTVARILELVENASEKKARSEAFITRFARYYTPAVVIAAVLLAAVPPLFFHQPFTEWLTRALTFLVISCPCALVVSVPLSFFGGIGAASKIGVLIKGANDLESLANVNTVVFDKTGTLTQGKFTVTAVHSDVMPPEALLDIAAVAESYSGHPIAACIVQAHGGHIDKSRISEIHEHAGLGIEAVIDGRTVLAGNGKLMDSAGVKWRPCHRPGTIVHIASGGEYMGHIVIADVVKPDAAEAVRALKAAGVAKTVMLTGDDEKVANAVAETLGIDEVHAKLLPEGKVQRVESLLAEKADARKTLAFVGDGVNDAPVLSRADVGIAMGALGSDAAIEAADVVLMDDKPAKLARAVRIARRTMRIVRENIVFSLLVKAVVLVLGALGLANMWLAVFADVGVLVLAILNAVRTLRVVK